MTSIAVEHPRNRGPERLLLQLRHCAPPSVRAVNCRCGKPSSASTIPRRRASAPSRAVCAWTCARSPTNTAANEDSLGKELFGADPACTHHASMGWVRDTFVGGRCRRGPAIGSRLRRADHGRLVPTAADKGNRRRDRAATAGRTSVASLGRRRERIASARFARLRLSCCAARQGDFRRFGRAGSLVRHRRASLRRPRRLRLAQKRLPALRRRIRYVLGLTCSSYRSLLFADLMTALMGRSRGILRYRSKRNARNGLDFRAELKTGESVRSVKMLGMFGLLVDQRGRNPPELPVLRRRVRRDGRRHVHGCLAARIQTRPARNQPGDFAQRRTQRHPERVVRLGRMRRRAHRRRANRAEPDRGAQASQGPAWRPDASWPPKRATTCRRNDCRLAQPSESELRDARRELAFFDAARAELLRFHRRVEHMPRWLARGCAWWLCWKVLLIAIRHGFFGKMIRGAKFFSSKPNTEPSESQS